MAGGGRQFPQGRILLDPAEVEPGACFPDTQADSSARSLVLSLYGTREKFRRPDVTIYDLKVSYTPETAEAVDSLYIDQLGLKIFADEFFSVFSPDSLQLPLHGEASR